MRRRTLLTAIAAPGVPSPVAGQEPDAATARMGPLRVGGDGRYFRRPDGTAIYLAGSHIWTNLQDVNAAEPPVPFDFDRYLDLLASRGHNFIRLWCWEAARVRCEAFETGPYLGFVAPLPYRRAPASDASGRRRFDLARFEPAYFQRLHARVQAAGARGIHVGLMLWNTWSVHDYSGEPERSPWPHHPYHRDNNVNGIDGDPRGTGDGAVVQTLAVPAVTALQEAYLRAVVDTVNHLDNVLYEITNEPIADAATAAWQNHMIGYLKGYQATKPQRHPVGMTAGFRPDPETINAQLRDGGADWISISIPEAEVHDPPPAERGRVSLLDTDHLPGGPFEAVWMWKAFTRGHNLLLMDALEGLGFGGLMSTWGADHAAVQHRGRIGLDGTLAAAALLRDMAGMAPRGELCTTGHALADPGRAYVVLTTDGSFLLDLSAAAGRTLAIRWFAVETGLVRDAGIVRGGSVMHRFDPPMTPAALVLTTIADDAGG